MAAVRARVLAELEHRVALLPHEIDRIEAAVAADEDGFRIHTRQMRVLRILMDQLLGRQRDLLAQLGRDVPDAEFAEWYVTLIFQEMMGAQRIWSVFSQAFAARHKPEMARHLDTADLVAADCYLLCLDQARNWGVLHEDQLREPPLVCPEAFPEPLALSRSESVGALGAFYDAAWRFQALRLPIPLVLMPADQIGCVWLLPALFHEVGHHVDSDLHLGAELAQVLGAGAVGIERRAAWQRWIAEILADAIGVLLGNEGFAGWLASLLLAIAPAERYRTLDPDITHPHPLVRILVLAAMLRRVGAPGLADVAARVTSDAQALPAPEGIAPFLGDVAAVAAAVLETRLAALRGHALPELSPELRADVKRTRLLADFLASGELRPAPDRPSPFPYRLVPAAAQLAVTGASPGPAPLDAVQQRATEFVAAIPRPPFLDGGARLSPRRAAFLAELARGIDFRGGG